MSLLQRWSVIVHFAVVFGRTARMQNSVIPSPHPAKESVTARLSEVSSFPALLVRSMATHSNARRPRGPTAAVGPLQERSRCHSGALECPKATALGRSVHTHGRSSSPNNAAFRRAKAHTHTRSPLKPLPHTPQSVTHKRGVHRSLLKSLPHILQSVTHERDFHTGGSQPRATPRFFPPFCCAPQCRP